MTTRTQTGSQLETSVAEPPGRADAVGEALSEVVGSVRGAAAEAAARIPEAASATRAAFDDANTQVQAGSDEMLTVGSALSLGVAGGLLIGGANRLLVAAALLPAAMMLLTLLERSSRSAKPSPSRRLQGD